jgi:glycine/D-amino acid oxidase-like deaminating enzyme
MSDYKTPAHIVVIGAGILGSAIAFRLAVRGANVTVIDAGEPGNGASTVSFAWLNARDKNPFSYHDLNRRSLDMWDRLARELGGDVGLTWGGELRWAATQNGGTDLAERVRLLQTWGYPIRLLDEAAVNQLEPDVQAGPISAASFSSADGHVDTGRVIEACLKKVEALGNRVLANRPATGFVFAETEHAGKRRIVTVETDAGPIACDAVVLAVGPDSPAVAALADIEVPLKHTFGASIITEPLPPIFRQAAIVQTAPDAAQQVSFRQFPDGRVMIHGGDSATESDSVGKSDADVEELFAAAVGYVPALANAQIQEVRRGRRPIPADGKAIVGFTEDVPNLYVTTMHSGVTLTALVSEMATSEILDGERIELLAPFRLERFARAAG